MLARQIQDNQGTRKLQTPPGFKSGLQSSVHKASFKVYLKTHDLTERFRIKEEAGGAWGSARRTTKYFLETTVPKKNMHQVNTTDFHTKQWKKDADRTETGKIKRNASQTKAQNSQYDVNGYLRQLNLYKKMEQEIINFRPETFEYGTTAVDPETRKCIKTTGKPVRGNFRYTKQQLEQKQALESGFDSDCTDLGTSLKRNTSKVTYKINQPGDRRTKPYSDFMKDRRDHTGRRFPAVPEAKKIPLRVIDSPRKPDADYQLQGIDPNWKPPENGDSKGLFSTGAVGDDPEIRAYDVEKTAGSTRTQTSSESPPTNSRPRAKKARKNPSPAHPSSRSKNNKKDDRNDPDVGSSTIRRKKR